MEEQTQQQHNRRQGQLQLGYRTIRRRVMRRIFILYLYHRMTSPLCIKSYLLMLSLAGLMAFVSIESVMANMPPLHDVTHVTLYSLKAFVQTELPVQVMTVVALAMAAAMVMPAMPRLLHATRILKPKVA